MDQAAYITYQQGYADSQAAQLESSYRIPSNLAEPEDGILVSRPVYGRFELDYGVESGVRMVYDSMDQAAYITYQQGYADSQAAQLESSYRIPSKLDIMSKL
jgi:diaminopimelate decarboxylase